MTRVSASVLRDLSHDATLALEQLNFGILVALESVVGIMMCADEIGRNVVAFTKVDELFNPFALRSRGSPDLQRRRHFFDHFSGITIELEIIALAATPELFQVRFVPDFEKPSTDFALA